MTKSVDAETIFADLSEARRRCLVSCSKGFILSVLIFMVISSTDSNILIRIKTPLSDISVMKIYAVFALSIASAASILELINFITIEEYQRIFSSKILKFDNSSARSTTYDPSSAWSHGIHVQFRFIETSKYHGTRSLLIAIILLSPIILSYFLIYIYSFQFMIEYMLGYSYVNFGYFLSAISIIFMIMPLSVAIFLFVPMKASKNVSFIRWGFLFHIRRKSGIHPPAPAHWLSPKP